MTIEYAQGSTNNSVNLQFLNSDGTQLNPQAPVSELPGLSLWYRREGGDLVTINIPFVGVPSLSYEHVDKALTYIASGMVRVDFPDAAFASGSPRVTFGGSFTGGVIVPREAMLVPPGQLGDFQVDITVENTDSALIPNAKVTILDNAETATVAVGYTNSSGVASLRLNNGSYKVLIGTVPGYDTEDAVTLNVSGSTALTITLDEVSPWLDRIYVKTETYDIPDHTSGDTWNGIALHAVVDDQDQPVNLVGSRIDMHVKDSLESEMALLIFTTLDSSITVDNGVGGIFSVNDRIIPLDGGQYFYDIQITFPDGTIKTAMKGTWKITHDVTP